MTTSEARRPASLSALQGLAPIFHLTTLRDAQSNFGARGKFWRPFLSEGGIPAERRAEIITALQGVNDLVIQHHQTLGQVRGRLASLRQLIAATDSADVSIDAVPPRIFDMLSRTQISLTAPGGAPVPLERHGDGTQSLAVLLLFDAFLKAKLMLGASAHAHPIMTLRGTGGASPSGRCTRAVRGSAESRGSEDLVDAQRRKSVAEVDISHVRRFARRAGKIRVFSCSGRFARGRSRLRKINHHVRGLAASSCSRGAGYSSRARPK